MSRLVDLIPKSRPEPSAPPRVAFRIVIPDRLALLALRGLLLWLVVPAAVLCWVPLAFWLRRKHVSFARFLGWVDLNFIAALQRSILRPLFRQPLPWTPVRSMPHVTHRVAWLDPA